MIGRNERKGPMGLALLCRLSGPSFRFARAGKGIGRFESARPDKESGGRKPCAGMPCKRWVASGQRRAGWPTIGSLAILVAGRRARTMLRARACAIIRAPRAYGG